MPGGIGRGETAAAAGAAALKPKVSPEVVVLPPCFRDGTPSAGSESKKVWCTDATEAVDAFRRKPLVDEERRGEAPTPSDAAVPLFVVGVNIRSKSSDCVRSMRIFSYV
jgi:hypothetical protein